MLMPTLLASIIQLVDECLIHETKYIGKSFAVPMGQAVIAKQYLAGSEHGVVHGLPMDSLG
jgi:hypothetical protein